MPNYTDYHIVVTTQVAVVATEGSRKVTEESFTVSSAGDTSTGGGRALRPTILNHVQRCRDKVAEHAGALQENEDTRRGVV